MSIYQIVWIPVLILFNALFVAAEMALARSRRTRIDQMAEEGNKAAALVQKHLDDYDGFISACQLGITICTLCLGALGEATFAEDLSHWVGQTIGVGQPAQLVTVAKAVCYSAAFIVMAFLQTAVGELLPKQFTFVRAESTILTMIYPMDLWCTITRPFNDGLKGFTEFIMRSFGVKEPLAHHHAHSEEELKMLVTESHEKGVLEPEEEEMLHSVFDFSETTAGEIMTPRTDLIGVTGTATVKEFVDIAMKHGFSRLPVYEDNLDNIFGLVHIRDCLRALVDHKETTHVGELARKVLVIPENKNLGDLLPEFQKSKTHMAIVVDEYGATRGIVTLEDLLEELVGDIADEYDIVKEYVQVQPDGSFIIDGKLDLEEANERFGLNIEDEEFNTLGGHVFGMLGREPEQGDEVKTDDFTLRIEESDRHRIIKLRLILHHRSGTAGDTNGSGKRSGGGNGSKESRQKSVEAKG
ncbi:MAG TPA: hemolysin family protein [Candidatus Obscuribacterales bacterium]